MFGKGLGSEKRERIGPELPKRSGLGWGSIQLSGAPCLDPFVLHEFFVALLARTQNKRLRDVRASLRHAVESQTPPILIPKTPSRFSPRSISIDVPGPLGVEVLRR